MATNTKIIFIERPKEGESTFEKIFKVVREPIGEIKEGEILVRNVYLSLDPAMRGWMRDVKSYIPPVQIGEVMRGGTVGEVVISKNSGFSVGDLVHHHGGWQEYTVSNGAGVMKVSSDFPITSWLGVLGLTGATAYFGLLDIGKPKAGETVLVSGAAGATGSVVGQIAKIKGCRVVGIAGSEDKCNWLKKELGFDDVINYKTAKNMRAELIRACPKGVDVYFDNVGGEILDHVLQVINMKARIVICGAISQYNNAAEAKGPKNYVSLLVKRARMEGFVVFDYAKQYKDAYAEMGRWIKEGKLKYNEHVVEGLENAPKSLGMLFNGTNSGKLLIKIGAEPRKAKL